MRPRSVFFCGVIRSERHTVRQPITLSQNNHLKGEHPMRKSKSLVIATSLAFLLAAAPMQAAPGFVRDSNPIGRFMKLVKKVFGVSTNAEVGGPPPSPTTA